MDSRDQKISRLLIDNRGQDKGFWYWLKPGQVVSRKDANKFLLGSILDFQMHAEVAWENARRLAEDILGDPEDLWLHIYNVSLSEWNSMRKQYSLHRFPKGHERVWTIGKRIVEQYDGDARKIWESQSIEAAMYRLTDLGVGEQISRMVVGALIDTGQIHGKGDVKVDIHVRRVLGRVLQGEAFVQQDQSIVIQWTRAAYAVNPWMLDRPLYLLGKRLCSASQPQCSECFLKSECEYYKARQRK